MRNLLLLLISFLIASCSSTPTGQLDTSARYRLTIDYDLSIERLKAEGRYDWSNVEITSQHFPSKETGERQVEVAIVPIGRYDTIDRVVASLGTEGIRPATLTELLAVGAQFPDLQREWSIIAFGSVWQTYVSRPDDVERSSATMRSYYAFLDTDGEKRTLDLWTPRNASRGLGPDDFRAFHGCFIHEAPDE